MQIERLIILSLTLFILFPSCAGDIKGERGEAGSAALASPTLTIRGGGKISWNAEKHQASFTEDIVIFDHSTGIATIITPSASPVTLADDNDVGYVQRPTSGGSEELTQIKVLPIEDLPIENQNNTVVSLFQRTDEDTLSMPWLQRELLDGDHFQFGAATSWYERKAAAGKPPIYNNDGDLSDLTVPASPEAPAVVFIDGKLYANIESTSADLDKVGVPGGLDTGSAENDIAYYVYGIPAPAGRSFDLVLSKDPPTIGPKGFSSWTYIGGWITGGSLNFHSGFSIGGRATITKKILVNSTRTSVYTWVSALKPVTASMAELEISLRTLETDTEDLDFVLSLNGTTAHLRVAAVNQNTSVYNETRTIQPILDGDGRFAYKWISTPPNDWTATIYVTGWIENPMDYK